MTVKQLDGIAQAVVKEVMRLVQQEDGEKMTLDEMKILTDKISLQLTWANAD